MLAMNYSITWPDEVRTRRSEADGDTVADANAAETDQQLVELVLAGDEAAFERLYERHKRLVAYVAARYFQSPERIEDIVQVSFIKAYFEFPNFRGLHDRSLASWLGRIAANACLDILRDEKRRPANLISDLTEAERDALADSFAAGETEDGLVRRDLAEKLLAHLEAEDRAILQMLYAEDMSVGEVKELTGWSTAKIKSRAFRARHTLKRVLRRFL